MRKVGKLHEEIDTYLAFYAEVFPQPILSEYPTVKPVISKRTVAAFANMFDFEGFEWPSAPGYSY